METAITILKTYWKHAEFRPLQEEIINSILSGTDTLAVLPTGGGKSVCFQVPALMMDGVCIVVTPLIALMDDQVMQLRKKEIQALAIHSGMKRYEIDRYLDNAVHGSIKFLYVSPERLKTEIFIERFKRMNVSLIAVDEAHCISQWGYDFRPPYLEIAALREIKPTVPFIALTATATKDVQRDIVEKLAFAPKHAVFIKSFARENLSFIVRKCEDKEKKLKEIFRKVPGPAIVYVRSRQGTQEIAEYLNRNGISASYYHAGLDSEERTVKQTGWIDNKVRVMVATNAFGMGIDKADVRMVVHLDIPENIESYYQEAGRAGRDGTRSYATIVYEEADVVNLQAKVEQSFPSAKYMGTVYQALANYFQLAMESGEWESFDFDLSVFVERFQFHAAEVYNALKKLEEQGLIQFNESYYSPSQLMIPVDAVRYYDFQIANAQFEKLLKMILRLYGGELYADFVRISEPYLAKAVKQPVDAIVKALVHLDQLQIIVYKPTKDHPQITFLTPRQDAKRLPLDHERMAVRKSLAVSKMNSMVGFVKTIQMCRMRYMQEYFGEETQTDCGICDVCVSRRKHDSQTASGELRNEVKVVITKEAMSIEELEARIGPQHHELFLDVVRDMVEEGELVYDEAWRLKMFTK